MSYTAVPLHRRWKLANDRTLGTNLVLSANYGYYNPGFILDPTGGLEMQAGRDFITAQSYGSVSQGLNVRPQKVVNVNARKHFHGSLAMAKTNAPNTGGCQFYITATPTVHLNGIHTVFGRVLSGLDVARIGIDLLEGGLLGAHGEIDHRIDQRDLEMQPRRGDAGEGPVAEDDAQLALVHRVPGA